MITVTVSVILPVYNRSHSLAAACNSVLGQSFRDLELIIVDDASSENLNPIVASLKDTRVRYIRHVKNAGAAAARNTGLAAAKGRLIAFQDSDDMWLPGKLERQVRLLDEMPAEIGVVTGGKILYGVNDRGIYGPGRVAYSPKFWRPLLSLEEDQVLRTLSENRLSVQCALFRRDSYPEIAWFVSGIRANEDWEFAVRLVQHTKVYEDIEPVLLAFASNDSISSSARKQLTGHLQILKQNRHLAELYPTAYGRGYYTFGKGLWNIGKKRTGLRFMIQGVRDAPDTLLYLAKMAVVRPLRKIGQIIS